MTYLKMLSPEQEREFQSLPIEDRVAELKTYDRSSLSDDSEAFLLSLLDWYDDKKFLSLNQRIWLGRFWIWFREQNADKVEISKLAVVEKDKYKFTGKFIYELLTNAEAHVKTPKLTYTLAESRVIKGVNNIQFQKAANKIDYDGAVFVFTKQKDLLDNSEKEKMLGIIKQEGLFIPADTTANEAGLLKQITDIMQKPLYHAYKSAEVNNQCICCQKLLPHAIDRLRGYDTVCASRWKLPLTDNRQEKLL